MPCWKVEFPLDLLEFPVNLLDFPLNFICNCGGLQCSCVLERSLDPREVDAIEGNSSTSVRTSRVLFAAEIRLLMLLLLVEADGLFVPFNGDTLETRWNLTAAAAARAMAPEAFLPEFFAARAVRARAAMTVRSLAPTACSRGAGQFNLDSTSSALR